MKDPLTEEEENYRLSLGEDRLQKRPDILLFPKAGKCIIIEFKNPVENVSDHLSQINKYASRLRNLTKEKFAIDTFFGYLIGQNIEVRHVRAAEIASNGVRGNRSKEGARISARYCAEPLARNVASGHSTNAICDQQAITDLVEAHKRAQKVW